MNRRLARTILFALAASTAGCVAEVQGPELLVPGTLEFPWDEAYNATDDGLSAVLPLDVLVYDVVTGEPLPGAAVELSADRVAFVLADDVLPGEAGCTECTWDAYRDEYVEVVPSHDGAPWVAHADATGLVRVYAVVDAVPEDAAGFAPITVRAAYDGLERYVRPAPPLGLALWSPSTNASADSTPGPATPWSIAPSRNWLRRAGGRKPWIAAGPPSRRVSRSAA